MIQSARDYKQDAQRRSERKKKETSISVKKRLVEKKL